ncbi:MAG: ATPase, partial [Actinobacteria bacterium]|nr:ATPase [Actinomycetota bacterium]
MTDDAGLVRPQAVSGRLTPDYVLAVDGGGSKTNVILFAADGTSLAKSRGGPCNLYRDAEAGLHAVLHAWEGCCKRAGLDPLASAASTALSAALAGTSARSGREHFLRGTHQFRRCCLSSDAYAALIGAFRGGPGALLSVGTGTVACRIDACFRFERRGGWGFPAGDRGGG